MEFFQLDIYLKASLTFLPFDEQCNLEKTGNFIANSRGCFRTHRTLKVKN